MKNAAPYLTPLITPDVVLEHDPLRLVSQDYGDVYFSTKSGLEETARVFLDGNDVVPRLRAAKTFTIAETGFGTGLNFLAVLREWRNIAEVKGDDAPRLHYIATEIAPLDPALIKDVLSAIPEIAEDAEMMVGELPPHWPGRHRRHFCGGKVTLDLLYGDSLGMITRSDFKADAWFLDGFTPAKNPEMWQAELFHSIAEKSADDATIASFTAAGDVRRGLKDAGFDIKRLPGFEHKWHRIAGRRKANEGLAQTVICDTALDFDEDVVVIGAGIAGASVAAGLMRHGVMPLVIGQGSGPHDGASGNIAAVQSPRMTAEESFSSQLSMTCYGYARWVAAKLGANLADQAVIYGWNEREEKRHGKILKQGLPESFVRRGDVAAMTAATGISGSTEGLIFDHGGGVDPRVLTQGLLGHAKTMYGCVVTETIPKDGGWQINFEDGTSMTTKRLVLAGGSGLAALTEGWGHDANQFPSVPFQVTAGRVSHLPPGTVSFETAVSFGGYLAEAKDGQIALGANFEYNINDDLSISNVVHEENINLLPDDLRAGLPEDFGQDKRGWSGRMSYRIATQDRQPMAGQLANGLYMLTALGARGMVTGPLLGEYVASLITDKPSPLDQGMVSLVDPMRFKDDGF